MKKLKLKAQELGAKEFLTRSQLKNIMGGFVAFTKLRPTCFMVCKVDQDCALTSDGCKTCSFVTGVGSYCG